MHRFFMEVWSDPARIAIYRGDLSNGVLVGQSTSSTQQLVILHVV